MTTKPQGDESEGMAHEMFEFTKKRMAQLEHDILVKYRFEKGMKGLSVTKLDNEASVRNEAELQSEMLKGNYKINIKPGLPYANKIVKLAQEPVAYLLYKKRHFKSLG